MAGDFVRDESETDGGADSQEKVECLVKDFSSGKTELEWDASEKALIPCEESTSPGHSIRKQQVLEINTARRILVTRSGGANLTMHRPEI